MRKLSLRLMGAVLSAGMFISCAPPREALRIQLDWTHDPQFAGLYAAIAAGDFAGEGFNPELREGKTWFGNYLDVGEAVLNGDADLGIMGWTLYQTAFQKNPDLVALGAAYQISPRVLMIKESKPWKTPKDLEGKTVGIKSPSWEALVRKVLLNAGADLSKVTFVPVTPGEMDRWYRDEIDVWTGFSISEPIQAERDGYGVRLWFADDYGAGAYEQILVADKKALDRNPGYYKRALAAWKKGWNRVVSEPESVPDWMLPWNLSADRNFIAKIIHKIILLVDPGRAPVGTIDPGRWVDLGGDPSALYGGLLP